jgi:hypothetical protein
VLGTAGPARSPLPHNVLTPFRSAFATSLLPASMPPFIIINKLH